MQEDRPSYQVLVVDDNQGLSALIQKKLQNEGYCTTWAQTGNEAISWLDNNQVDLMLLDYKLPDMTGKDVIEKLLRNGNMVPFILITGQGDEQLAVDMLKMGAIDYLVKDIASLELLPKVVTQALNQVMQQKRLEATENALRERESQYREIFNSTSDIFFVVNSEGIIVQANPRASLLYGYCNNELLGMHFDNLNQSDHDDLIRHIQLCVRQAGEYSSEALNVKKDGSLFDAEITGTSFNYGESAHLLVTVRDISERKWAEEELKLTNQQLRVSEQALREREARLRAIFQGSAIGIVLSDLSGRPIESNQAFQHMLGYSTMTLRQMTFTQYIHPDDRQASLDIFQDLVQGKCDHYKIEQRYIRKDQSINWVRMTASLIRNESGTPDYVIKIIEDISQRKATEESYRQSETKYKYLFENLLDAFAYHRIIYDSENTPVDYVFLEVNNAFEQITGLKRLDIIGKKVSEILPDIKKRIFNWIEAFEKVEASGSAIKFEKYSEPLNRWFLVSAYSPEKGYFVTIIEDITDRRLIEEEIRSFATELECSNRQLELFAHTVSSDFQEHLRSVSHGATSLAQQYAGKLDPKANELIQCMTQKTERMEIMLADLLLYSKLACRGNPFESIDLNDLVLCIIKDLDETIKKTHSTIITEPLPTIQGDRNQIGQMFEKIIDNAIKFRSNEPLKITIESKENTSNWEIIITDNGIGIDPDQHERIFDIFYCLHSQNVYPGTGMGLPVSKKIVERHGGKIWLDSQVGQGSKFYLSLPKPTLHSL